MLFVLSLGGCIFNKESWLVSLPRSRSVSIVAVLLIVDKHGSDTLLMCCKSITFSFTSSSCLLIAHLSFGVDVHGNIEGKCVLDILSPPGKCAPQILVFGALSLSVLFLISFSYMFFTVGSLGNVWNFMVGEFLQLFGHPGTQQPTFTILNEVL